MYLTLQSNDIKFKRNNPIPNYDPNITYNKEVADKVLAEHFYTEAHLETPCQLWEQRRSHKRNWGKVDDQISYGLLSVAQVPHTERRWYPIQHTTLMKNINFKLTDDEESVVNVVTSNHKHRHFKDPKIVYMDAIMKALKGVSK